MTASKVVIELIGYLGSALVVISMLLTSVKRLRIVNTTGSVIFAIYALIIRSYPTAVMNFCLVVINVYQLYRLSVSQARYRLVEASGREPVVADLVSYYENDIRHFFPDFDLETAAECNVVYLILIGTAPAGFLAGKRINADTVDIKADYSLPAYRDLTVGRFLYGVLPEKGVKRLLFRVSSVDHVHYMKRMGFVQTAEGYEKVL